VQAAGNNIGTWSSTSKTRQEPEASEWDTVHTIPQLSETFQITPRMMHMDEIVGKTPLKDLAQLQLVLSRIPSKALHKLHVSFTQEVQSRACTDTSKLQQVKDKWDTLELIYEKANIETKEERECMNGLEQKVVETYEKIPKTTQRAELIATEKIDQIVQEINQYQHEIGNIRE
jgi:hypothetical protein